MVSVFQAPILRWVVAPRPDQAVVAALAGRLHLPAGAGRAAGPARPRRRRRRPALTSGPPLDDLSDPYALAGMAEAVEAIAAAVRAGGTIMVHGDYDVDGQCATALLTRALRAAGRRRACRSCRTGCATATTSARPGSRPPRAAGASLDHHLRLRHHRGGDRARRARGGHRRRRHRPPPPGRRAAAGARGRRPAAAGRYLRGQRSLRHRRRLQAGAGAGAGARPAGQPPATTCSTAWRSPPWPTSCRSVGENRILVKHGLKLLAESRWPGLRALVEASGPRRQGDPRRPPRLHPRPPAQRGGPDRRRDRRAAAAAHRRPAEAARAGPAARGH